MSELKNKKLYAVTGLSFFWGPDKNEDHTGELLRAAFNAFQEDFDMCPDGSIFEITKDDTPESILAESREANAKAISFNVCLPWGETPKDFLAPNGVDSQTINECIKTMKKKAESSIDNKVVEIDGKKYKLTEVK